ncbi:FkbM family methyltransferase [Sulfolobus sp. S-194]|uniref:FkbM family methyltransferase n=1 Tax=Sulfolobus sp. S-194 TaxID=2512240 RepID=UPI00256FF2F9|nr:FkbM family methyltransferase [Sulfolobus sp. S-194]
MLFTYGKTKICIPPGYEYVYYATFIAGEWDFLKVKREDVILDAGAFVGDFTVKVAKKAKEVVAVEPLPWAFQLLKKNVEMNGLKNVVLVNKALYDVEGVKVKISDEGTGSKIGEEGIEAETTTIESLGKFSVVKMDIEGAEGKLFKRREWLGSIKQIAIELHGKENIERIPTVLKEEGFNLRFMKKDRFNKGNA